VGGNENLTQLLMDLGLGKTEASAYITLLELSKTGPATGYQVAKALGKNPTTVYGALEDLLKRGAVETVAGRGRQFRPISPESLTRKLSVDFEARAEEARKRLASLHQETEYDEVLRLHTQSQVLERFEALLDGCEKVALIQLAPDLLDRFLDHIAAARGRGVAVVMRLYRQPTPEQLTALAGTTWTVEPFGPSALMIMPGPVLHGAFDCRAQLSTFLTSDWQSPRPGVDPAVPQAFWSGNRFLAYQAHSGLASEIIHTELRAMLLKGSDPAEMQTRQDELARLIHGPVDWPGFWKETGWGDGQGAEEARLGTPWGAGGIVRAAEISFRSEPYFHRGSEQGLPVPDDLLRELAELKERTREGKGE